LALRGNIGYIAPDGGNRVRARPSERFSETIRLTPEEASAFARAAGDYNPIHHDREFAARTRYKRPLASGTQTTARLMALTATHFSKRGDMVGLDFSVRFHRPIYADETIHLEWQVVSVEDAPTLNGELVELRGQILNEAGEMAVNAKGRVLVTDRL
jgi:3-hydroxybutyryl-CoA dehydratase